jgi:hypothetical protein
MKLSRFQFTTSQMLQAISWFAAAMTCVAAAGRSRSADLMSEQLICLAIVLAAAGVGAMFGQTPHAILSSALGLAIIGTILWILSMLFWTGSEPKELAVG